MNRRQRNKAAAAATPKPAPAPKQTPLAKTTPPPEPTPVSSAKSAPAQPAKPAPPLAKSQSSSPSSRLRTEWKTFEVWLSARRADRDKQVSERLKELMSATGKTKMQKQPADMATFERNLNEELAHQAREEWLRRLSAAGLNEEDWVDITEQEMKRVETAFTPQEPGSLATSLATPPAAKAVSEEKMPSPPGGLDWNAPVPGSWDAPSSSTSTNPVTKKQLDTSAPARSSPLSNEWGIFGDKPTLPTPESLWEMHMTKHAQAPPKPPTPPSEKIAPGNLPTPESLWEMHVAKRAPPPPTPPPTEPVSPDALWESAVHKRLPVRETATPAPPKKAVNGRPANPPPQQTGSLWGSPPGPQAPIAIPTYTGNSIESAHNHGYMSPLLIELECDEFPIAPQDILTDDIVESSIRQWHKQAADADIRLRKQLVSMHWAKRDWDELLGSHIQEMERNARAVIEHWKSICEMEKERRMKEDKQRRLAGIRNVTSGNRRWGSSPVSPPEGRTSSPAPTAARKTPLPEPKKPVVAESKKAQPLRKGPVKKHAATVEDATSSEWEERSATPSLPSERPKPGRKNSVDVDSMWSKDAPAPSKGGAPSLISSLWGKSAAPPPEREPSVTNERKKPIGGLGKKVLSPVAEPARKTATPLPWDEPQGQKNNGKFWAGGTGVSPDDDILEPPGGSSLWGQSVLDGARGGAASAWNFAMNAINNDKPSVMPTKPTNKASPPVNGPGSFWSNEPAFARMMSEGAGDGLDGRFTPWKPSTLEPPDEDDPTTKMANLAMQHLYQTVDTEGEIDPSEAHNAMLMYTQAAATTRKKR